MFGIEHYSVYSTHTRAATSDYFHNQSVTNLTFIFLLSLNNVCEAVYSEKQEEFVKSFASIYTNIG